MYYASFPVTELIGKIPVKVVNRSESVYFRMSDGSEWELRHNQDCCESVSLEDVVGDLEDLVNNPILEAYESFNSGAPAPEGSYGGDSTTWSFFRFRSIKGTVVIRFFGSSNGYYSETADLYRIK